MPIKILTLMIITMLSASYTAYAQGNEKLHFDAMLTSYAYPFEVKYHEFSAQGQDLKMAYMYLPPATAENETLILLHGKNFNGAYWESTAKLLNAKGYGVLIPDQIGFGKSSKTTAYQYSFAALAKNTKDLMTALDIKKSVILGHSMGGMLASRFALLYPDSTTKLILLNPIGLENYLQYVDYKDIHFFTQKERKIKAENIISYQKKNYYDGAWNADYAALTTPLIGWIQGPDWDQIAQVSALTYDMIFTQPVIEEFKYLTMPTTLILGTRDRTGPGRGWKKTGVTRELGRYDQLGAEVKERNEKIQLIELDGLGHLPQHEDFTRFKTALFKALN
jgi:pimeloyl-ACP methyl ester carboxylesterase|tara:strand:- start:193197 stop:194201 length:1005 start_codon:yes stop_codon:yes gene_type:complete